MPVEIDEIVITVEVGAPPAAGVAAPPAPLEDRAALIRECVEQVLQVLRDREEP